MVKLQKIAYGVGISIAVSVFVLFLYSFLPYVIQNNAWDKFDDIDLSQEEMLKKFQDHPAYAAFYERFHDAKEELNYNPKESRATMEVGIRNSENGHAVLLHMYYNEYEERVTANINCELQNVELNSDRLPLHANGLFVLDFIEQTECLEFEN